MGTARDLQPFRCDVDSLCLDLVDLFEKRFRIDDHSVPQYARFIGMNDSRRKQSKHECPIADVNAMSGVVTALVTRNDVEPFRQKVNDLAFSFVAPLGTYNYNDHNSL